MLNNTAANAKVIFRVPNDDGSAEAETLWATHLEGDRYKLDNSPFYAYGVSWEDVVLAPFSQDEDGAVFERVLVKSGNRTIRIAFDIPVEDGNASAKILDGVVALGCDYEGASRKHISVNVPPHVFLDAVRDYLTQQSATWEHADPTYESLFPDESAS